MKAMSHSHKLLAALLIAGVLLLPAGFLPDPGRAFVLDPQIAVDPDIGRPGSGVQVSGTGLPPFSSVIIGFSENGMEQVVGFTSTDQDGNFTATVTVPEDAAPGQAIFFADSAGGRAEADFFVDVSEETGGGGGKEPPETCTVTLTLFSMRVIEPLPNAHEWRIRTTSKIGHKVSTIVKSKEPEPNRPYEEIEIGLVVGSKTVPKKNFPFEDNLRAHVDHAPSLSSGGAKASKAFDKTRPVLRCPDEWFELLLPEGTGPGPAKDPFSLFVEYRYDVTEP